MHERLIKHRESSVFCLLVEQVIAVYDYEAQHEDELSFFKGCVINVISKDGSEWWQGELNGRTGLLPFNYVKPLSDYTVAEQHSAQLSESRKNLFPKPFMHIQGLTTVLESFIALVIFFERASLNALPFFRQFSFKII